MSDSAATQTDTAIQLSAIALENLWVVHYRKGGNPFPLAGFYPYKGNIQGALKVFRTHCDRMGWKFVRVTPFLSNVAEELKNAGEE